MSNDPFVSKGDGVERPPFPILPPLASPAAEKAPHWMLGLFRRLVRSNGPRRGRAKRLLFGTGPAAHIFGCGSAAPG